MKNLVGRLDENGVLEEYYGPWGALMDLDEKPHHEKVPRKKYQWRMCVSYQNMNHFTHPFTFPISLFDDAVQDIDTEANYFISVDMESGYWQVVAKDCNFSPRTESGGGKWCLWGT